MSIHRPARTWVFPAASPVEVAIGAAVLPSVTLSPARSRTQLFGALTRPCGTVVGAFSANSTEEPFRLGVIVSLGLIRLKSSPWAAESRTVRRSPSPQPPDGQSPVRSVALVPLPVAVA